MISFKNNKKSPVLFFLLFSLLAYIFVVRWHTLVLLPAFIYESYFSTNIY